MTTKTKLLATRKDGSQFGYTFNGSFSLHGLFKKHKEAERIELTTECEGETSNLVFDRNQFKADYVN